MRSLKVLVVVMGVMLIGGFATLVAVIAGRLSRSVSATRTFAAPPIDIPRDSRIELMTAGPDRLVLELVLPGGGRQLVIIDLATGVHLGTIELRAAP
jgi:hypothetical protein